MINPQDEGTYLFVDGENFRRYFNEATHKWFGQDVGFDFHLIKNAFAAEKAFYYDCIDETQNDKESDREYEERVAAQEDWLNKIREVEGCHVYLGSLRKAASQKKRSQKEVDVMLAVQMMEHAFRGNMNKAVLLSGDLDFRPLVECLVRMGLFIHVAADQKHVSADLIYSADKHTKLNFRHYYDWTLRECQKLNRCEVAPMQFYPDGAENHGFEIIKTGIWKDEQVVLFKHENKGLRLFSKLIFPTEDNVYGLSPNHSIKLLTSDLVSEMFNKLDLYFELMHGKIDWT